MARIAITGATGLLGTALMARLSGQGHIVRGFSHNTEASDIERLDIRSNNDLAQIFATGFDICINCAANPNVGWCERNPDQAWDLNVTGAINVADACRANSIWLTHISTDYVFDGHRKLEFGESDDLAPLQVYGRTKAEAEMYVAKIPGNLIVRLPLLFGPGSRRTWPIDVANALATGTPVVADAHDVRQPALTSDVAIAIAGCLSKEISGILHVAPDGGTTRFNWGQLIAKIMQADPALVVPDESAVRGVARPPHSFLSNDKLRGLGIKVPRSYDQTTEGFLRMEGYLS